MLDVDSEEPNGRVTAYWLLAHAIMPCSDILVAQTADGEKSRSKNDFLNCLWPMLNTKIWMMLTLVRGDAFWK